MASQQNDRHDRCQDHAELWLDEAGEDGQDGRTFGVAPQQGGQAEQHDQRANGVGLAP